MAATPAICSGRFWRVTMSVLGALCMLTDRAAGASCPPATPNACFNAPGTTSMCCAGACGPTTGLNGETATCADSGPPPPTMTIYVVFNYSDPGANCANTAAAPGAAYQFGDVCAYYVPIVDSSGSVLGSAIYAESTVAVDANGVDITAKSAHTYYFGDNTPLSAAPDSLNFEGQTMNYVFQLPITGGTGKYLGAQGYYISQTQFTKTIGNDTILYIPKDIYILN